jgi:hypothetical protein
MAGGARGIRNGVGRLIGRVAMVAPVLVLASALVVTTGDGPAGANLAQARNRTVLLVHGFSPSSTPSTDCSSTWGQTISQLQGMGFTGPFVTIGFYNADTNCNVQLHNYGSYSDGDSWKSVAKAFSWYVHDTYGTNPVDVIGYSMGGLVVRGGLYGAQSGASGFSPAINLADVVTMGTPHQGANWYVNFCPIIGWTSCAAMAPGSTDLNWLNQNGNPQGTQGTTWTNIGSNNDEVVPASSATSMSIPLDHKVIFNSISHTGLIYPWYGASWDVINRAADALGYPTTTVKSGVNTNLCIDDWHSGTGDGNVVDIYTCNGTGAQVWTMAGSGKTLLTVNGMCLDDTNFGTNAGNKLQLWHCDGGANQEWTPGPNNSLRVYGMCLDDPGSTQTPGTQLQIWTCNGTNAQRWYYN